MQIRKKVFETNSSSSHSVVIAEGTDFVVPKIKSDKIEIRAGEFGWEEESYYDFFSKASYAFTYAKNDGKSEDMDNLENVIKEFTKKEVAFFPLSGDQKYERTIGILKHLSKQGINIPLDKALKQAEESKKDEEKDWGYIDHQSVEEAERIFKSKDSIKKFLFGKDSYFKTDNDNH